MAEVNLRVHRGVGGETDLAGITGVTQRADETRRPAHGEQFFRVGAVAGRPGRRQFEVESAVLAQPLAFTPSGGPGVGGVQNLFNVDHEMSW